MQLRKSENKSEELATLSKPIQGAWREGCTMRAVHAVQHQVLKLPQVADFAASQLRAPISILVGQQGTQHEAFLCNSTQLAFNCAAVLARYFLIVSRHHSVASRGFKNDRGAHHGRDKD